MLAVLTVNPPQLDKSALDNSRSRVVVIVFMGCPHDNIDLRMSLRIGHGIGIGFGHGIGIGGCALFHRRETGRGMAGLAGFIALVIGPQVKKPPR